MRISASILIKLWTYTGLDKIFRFDQSRKAFLNQPIPVELEEVLSYAVPGTELLLSKLLLFSVLILGIPKPMLTLNLHPNPGGSLSRC